MRRAQRSIKPDATAPDAPLNHLVQSYKGPTANKQNVGGIDLDELLMRMLATSLGRNIGHRAFQDFQKCLLHPFTGDITGDGGIFIFSRNFVDFIDVDDPLHATVAVASSRLQQLENNVFHVLADITRFGQGGCVDDSKGHGKHAGQSLG